MQTKENMTIREFKNLYCDAISCGLGQFIEIDETNYMDVVNSLSREEIECICQYSVLKNKLAGVGELNLKVPYCRMGVDALERYGLRGNEILSAQTVNGLCAKDLLGGRMIVEIESIDNYNATALSDIADFCATTDTPVVVNFGQSLEEVGRVVNKFGQSPASVLEGYGLLDRKCFLKGFNFIDKDDQILLSNYNPTVILSPLSDAECGKGAINLYNLIYNRLTFCFSSDKCYNIDMLREAKTALLNTNNLMYQRDLVGYDDLIDAICSKEGEIRIKMGEFDRKETLFDRSFICKCGDLQHERIQLEQKIKTIVQKLKENTNGN